MSDLFETVKGGQDIFKKLLSYVPGFSGYIERTNRRAADKLLRDQVALKYSELAARISRMQKDIADAGQIAVAPGEIRYHRMGPAGGAVALSHIVVAPRALACSYSSSTTMPAPSPRTKPLRSLSNGRLAVCGWSLLSESALQLM